MPITTEDILHWLSRLAQVLREQRDYLTQLDSAIGDADHGINMERGFKAVVGKIQSQAETDIGSLLKLVGTTLVSTVGGASGPLYGTAFLRAGLALADKRELDAAAYVALLEAAGGDVDDLCPGGRAAVLPVRHPVPLVQLSVESRSTLHIAVHRASIHI